jgi:hypothetical protein
MKPALLFGDFGQTARFSKSTPFANSSLPPNTSCAGRLSPEDLGTYRRKMAAPQIFFRECLHDRLRPKWAETSIT